MAKFVSDVVEIGSFGLIDDPFGIDAGEEAAERAAGVQERGAERGIAETRRQFDLIQEREAPVIEARNQALAQQQALLGLSGQEAQQQAFAGLQESPGQKFIRERQQKALLRGASAIGGLGGGNVRTALQQQAAGFAQQDIQNQFGRLGQVVAPGQQSAQNLGQFGTQAAGNIANLGVAGSEARASGILGKASIAPQVTGQLMELGGDAATMAFLSDERLKHGIVKVDEDDNGGIYRFKYIGDTVEYIGRMAQELMKTRPDAVSTHHSGYFQVSKEFAPTRVI